MDVLFPVEIIIIVNNHERISKNIYSCQNHEWNREEKDSF